MLSILREAEGGSKALGVSSAGSHLLSCKKGTIVPAPLEWVKNTELRRCCSSHQDREERQTHDFLDFLSPPQSLRSLGLLFEAARAIPDQSQGTVTKIIFYVFTLSPCLPCGLCNYRAHIHPKRSVCPTLDHQEHQP